MHVLHPRSRNSISLINAKSKRERPFDDSIQRCINVCIISCLYGSMSYLTMRLMTIKDVDVCRVSIFAILCAKFDVINKKTKMYVSWYAIVFFARFLYSKLPSSDRYRYVSLLGRHRMSIQDLQFGATEMADVRPVCWLTDSFVEVQTSNSKKEKKITGKAQSVVHTRWIIQILFFKIGRKKQ